MKITRIVSQSRRDFVAKYECEHCGDVHEGRGYDDANFHNNVIPKMPCRNTECGKTSGDDYRPLTTKYPAGMQV